MAFCILLVIFVVMEIHRSRVWVDNKLPVVLIEQTPCSQKGTGIKGERLN